MSLAGACTQPITSVADFTNKGLTACTRNNSDVDWLRRKYPQMQLLVVAGDNNPTTGEAVYSNIKQGLCAGAITTDTHARYSLMHSTATCGLQLVGQAVNFGYYAMAVRGTPDFEPVQRGLDVLMASFLENQADASYKTQFLTSTITCPAAPAVQQTTQMHISDLGGLFILQAAVLGLCFVWYISRKAVLRVGAARAAAEEAATKHRLKSQQQQRANSTATTAVVSQAQHARSEGNLTQRSPGSC